MTKMKRTAVFPGTFDPITNGHYDLAKRASGMFDKIVVAVADSTEKTPLFTLDERIDLARTCMQHLPHVQVIGFSGLLIDFANSIGAQVILRGLRAVSDFEYEFQLASMNRKLEPNVETVFLTPAENHTFVSASRIKEIAKYHGDVSPFVHETVLAALRAKYNTPT